MNLKDGVDLIPARLYMCNLKDVWGRNPDLPDRARLPEIEEGFMNQPRPVTARRRQLRRLYNAKKDIDCG